MTTFVGKRLQNGKYTLDQELGRGGFGVTYRAMHHLLDQVVVIKTVNVALRQDKNFADFQRQFQDEAKRLAMCVHPGIVRVSDFFIEDGLPYMVMDYIPGATLAQVAWSSSLLSEATTIDYIRQVGAALEAVHRLGLLHRDVKPHNLILRQGTGQVVLIDFGTAREFSPGLTQTHTSMFSEGYAPIEQYLPQAKRTAAIDVYGLAATLYTLVTSQVPIASVLRDRQPLSEPRQLRPDLSPATNQAILRGMALELHHRPATVNEWLALLPETKAASPARFSIEPSPATIEPSQKTTVAVGSLHSSEQNTILKRVSGSRSQTNPRKAWLPWLLGGVVLGGASLGVLAAKVSIPEVVPVASPPVKSPIAKPPTSKPRVEVEPSSERAITPVPSAKPSPRVVPTEVSQPVVTPSASPSESPELMPDPAPPPTPNQAPDAFVDVEPYVEPPSWASPSPGVPPSNQSELRREDKEEKRERKERRHDEKRQEKEVRDD
jgi:serine/threonine protein kinase